MSKGTEEPKAELRCVDCGRPLLQEGLLSRWGPCHFCNKPVCFDCSHYVATRVKGLYVEYVDVHRTCNKCHPHLGPQ
jgi:hypothetical protein